MNTNNYDNYTNSATGTSNPFIETTSDLIAKADTGIKLGFGYIGFFILDILIHSLLPANIFTNFLASTCGLFALGLLILSYVIGGGLAKAGSMAFKFAKWSWLLIPVFPVDCVVAIVGVDIILLMLFFCPPLFIWLCKREYVKEFNNMQKNMAYKQEMQNYDIMDNNY